VIIGLRACRRPNAANAWIQFPQVNNNRPVEASAFRPFRPV
jgi:hypothetical protein